MKLSSETPLAPGKLIQTIRDMDLPELWIMEICGTHTMSIAKAGLRQILPPHIHLISGPGCPVCVTPSGVMDEVLRISQLPNVTITTYGDLLRVPGSVPGDNLQRRSAQGADVRMVYSPMDSLDMAEQEPDREFIFLGVGFENHRAGDGHRRAGGEGSRTEEFFPALPAQTDGACHAGHHRER